MRRTDDEALLEETVVSFFHAHGLPDHIRASLVAFHASEYWHSLSLSHRAFLIVAMDRIHTDVWRALHSDFATHRPLLPRLRATTPPSVPAAARPPTTALP
jgi:hypothetical protein